MSKSYQAQRGVARTKYPERTQVEMRLLALDQWLDAEHRVRTVWRYVESLDLSELYEPIRATEGNVGRDAIDPRILFALWLFATLGRHVHRPPRRGTDRPRHPLHVDLRRGLGQLSPPE